MFDPEDDEIVEDDEAMEFRAMTTNSLDVFSSDNGIFQTVVDDDGMIQCIIYTIVYVCGNSCMVVNKVVLMVDLVSD